MSYEFPQIRRACISITLRKKSQYWNALSSDENSEKLESLALIDGRSMLAILPTVLY